MQSLKPSFWIRRIAIRIHSWLSPIVVKDFEFIVRQLVLGVTALELPNGSVVEFAPLKGTCGPFNVSGNTLPVFEYRVFEKKLMEFIKVRVEIGRPDLIRFICTIDGTDPKTHGKAVESCQRYEAPFFRLASVLVQYFPIQAAFVWKIQKGAAEICAQKVEKEENCYDAGCEGVQDTMRSNCALAIRSLRWGALP